MTDKRLIVLTQTQRRLFTSIPDNIRESELVRNFTLTPEELDFTKRQRGSHNRLGVAIQLCVLRYLGRTLTDLSSVPERVVNYVASQLEIDPTAYARYGERISTFYEHLDRIREQFGYRDCTWFDTLHLTRELIPLAMESDETIPLMEAAMAFMLQRRVIAPGITRTEHLIRRVLQIARRIIYERLTSQLTPEQCQTLDDLLVVQDDDDFVLTRLAWLRVPAPKPSPAGMHHLQERISFLQNLALLPLPTNVHPNRVRQLANRCRHYQAKPLSLFKPQQRWAYLFAYLADLKPELVDQWVDMFDRWVADLMRKGRNAQTYFLHSNVKRLNRVVNTFARAIHALLEAREQGADPYDAVFAAVNEDELTHTLTTAHATMRPANMDYRDLLNRRYALRRKELLAMFRELSFEAVQDNDPALDALEYVLLLEDEHDKRVDAVEQTVEGETLQAPLDHLRYTRWKRHALDGETIKANYYEMAAFQRLKRGLRSGDIAVQGSRRYQGFESYLLSSEEWQRLKRLGDTRLDASGDADEYLKACQNRITDLLAQLQQSIEVGGPISRDKDGTLHLEKLAKSTPDEATSLSKKLYRYLPWVHLADVIVEVDGWTGFLQSFTHLQSEEAPEDAQKGVLIAALMASGMNLGLTKMAQATDHSYRQLLWAADWLIRDDTLQKALATLDNFVLHHPYSRHWGHGVASSSDGMRVPVTVNAANAVYNARYFGFKRGITIVTHAVDIWMPFQTQVTNDVREALYVIDALCHHETDFDILEHFTDHAGYTYHVFALCRLLGFRFAPRIRSVTKQYLFTVEPVEVSEQLEHLMKGTAEANLIREDWDEMRRLAASIRHGSVSATLIMRKLASYPKQNQLARAFNEVGKLERTIFVLEFMLDQALQRRSRLGLNKGEAIHSLGTALSLIGQGGDMSERDIDAQMNRARSLMLLVSVIAAWNTVYLDKVVSTLRAEGVTIPDEYLAHVSPLKWQHINFIGKYDFDLSQTYPLDNLRPIWKPDAGL